MITVSIVSHRQAELVSLLLGDLARDDRAEVSRILVTRNVAESPPVVPEALASRTRLIDNAVPKGFGANHNAAFAHCATPYFAILNPDLRCPVDPFVPLQRRFGAPSSGRVGMLAPTIVAPDGRREDAARRLITPWQLLRRRLLGRGREAVQHPDWLAGMFLLVRSETFRAMSGFDERYFMYCEDVDFSARMRLAGWGFEVDPTVEVVHDARRATGASPRHFAWHMTSLLRLWSSSAFWRYRQWLACTGR